jgi:hypothetical protein
MTIGNGQMENENVITHLPLTLVAREIVPKPVPITLFNDF